MSAAEPELLDRTLARLNLLLGSEDDRVALRAVKEVLDLLRRDDPLFSLTIARNAGVEAAGMGGVLGF